MAKEAARTQPDRATFTDVSFALVQPSSANHKSQHCILAVALGGVGFFRKSLAVFPARYGARKTGL